MELSEKEWHCVARMLQGGWYGYKHRPDSACEFCKYRQECWQGDWECYKPSGFFKEVAEKITKLTGVDLMPEKNVTYLPLCRVNQKRFLKNSTPEMIDYCKNFFAE